MHEKKRILSFILALCMVVTMTVMPVSATEKTTKGNTTGDFVKPLKGDGTKEDPYQIANEDNLYWFAATVNGTDNLNKNESACATLVNDITVNTEVLNKDGTLNGNGESFRVWKPIGTYSYKGTFDGDGHTIQGLYINTSSSYVGLFGFNSGTIKNVNVIDSYFKGGSFIGGVCGDNSGIITNSTNSVSLNGTTNVGGVSGINYGSITNCINSGSVKGTGSAVGGVSGYNDDGSITNSSNSGSVSGQNVVGGVSGQGDGSITNCNNSGSVSGQNVVGGVSGQSDGSITNCNNSGSVKGTGSAVGGVSGTNNGSITNCINGGGSVSGQDVVGGVSGTNNGSIINCINKDSVKGTNSTVGGVSGVNYDSINNCINSGSVNGRHTVGGVSGENSNKSSINNCINSGSVSGTTTVGGVNGYNNESTITNCINSGSVSGISNVGGVNGYEYEGTITNCYYDKENCTTGGISGEDVRGSAEGRTPTAFASGEITWLLNGKKSTPAEGETLPWGQTLSGEKADAYPVLGGATVYQVNKYITCDTTGSSTKIYSNTNEPILGAHTYGDPTLTWTKNTKTGGYDCTAKRTCTVHSDHIDEKSCTVTSVTKPATLYESGKTIYTAKVSLDNKEYTDTKEVIIPQKKNIASAGVSGIYNKNYTGKSQTQSKISVKVGSTTLKAGTDYIVSYTNNKYIGTATITIIGKGNYGGSLKKTFKITISKGKTYTVSSKKYKVTNASTSGKGTVTLTGVTTSKSKLSSLSIGNTVKIGNKTFKITAIGSNAWKNYTKLKKVTIGNNVTSIGKSAFYNCKKLSKLTIKSTKLKSVGSKAIKNIKKNAKIDVPNKKVSKYKKLFKSSTGYKKTMKIK
ncbi:MAG: leucine-rich repeat protein [Anaerostipes sp.]